MTKTADCSPQEIVCSNVEWCCWASSGWEDAGEGSVRDASTTTRGEAAAFFARELGDFTAVRVWKRYVERFTRQQVWDGPGKDRWVDREEANLISQRALDGSPNDSIPSLGELHAQAPAVPPADWHPDDYDAVWQFVRRDHPRAVPVWICGYKGDAPPDSPAATPRSQASTNREEDR